MPVSVNAVIKTIAPINNRYRDPVASTRTKLEALWEMGDQLVTMGVTSPHTVGWAVQRETRGLIKRPTVFRSHKIRTIWPSKGNLLGDIGQLRWLSNLTEIIPLIDPAQNVRRQLSNGQINDLYHRACFDPPQKFKRYLAELKRNFARGRLGKPLDRSRHLYEIHFIVSNCKILLTHLLKILDQTDPIERKRFRTGTPAEELEVFSNMCIALTTKENYRLYKQLGPSVSTSQNQQFQILYNHFHKILSKTGDVERARLRRLISAEALAQISDMVSSLVSEPAVQDFKARREMAISL